MRFSLIQLYCKATQLLSFSACYKAANNNLCSSKQLTQSRLTLFSFFPSTLCLECTQVHTPRLHDCGIWEAQVGKLWKRDEKRMGWKEAYAVQVWTKRKKTRQKGGRRNTRDSERWKEGSKDECLMWFRWPTTDGTAPSELILLHSSTIQKSIIKCYEEDNHWIIRSGLDKMVQLYNIRFQIQRIWC